MKEEEDGGSKKEGGRRKRKKKRRVKRKEEAVEAMLSGTTDTERISGKLKEEVERRKNKLDHDEQALRDNYQHQVGKESISPLSLPPLSSSSSLSLFACL